MTRFFTHWTIWFALSLFLTAIPLMRANAMGGPCGPRDVIVEQLESSFGEVLAGQGIVAGGTMTGEMAVNPASGSWTVFITKPDGISCIALGGDGWEFSMPEPKGQGL